MKKQIIVIITVIALLAVAACFLAACGEKDLDCPHNLDIVDNCFVWDGVEGASGYLVYFNDVEKDRFYTTETYISVDSPYIQANLRSGKLNNMNVRAVVLNAKNQPVQMSKRSKLEFDYSRKLDTPNKLKMKGTTFSWRSVDGATDYKALVRKDGSSVVTQYDTEWKIGTTGVNAVIKGLKNGDMYQVSFIAVADGYEDSDPTEEIPFDRTAEPAEGSAEPDAETPQEDHSGQWTVTFKILEKGEVKTTLVGYADNNKPVATPAKPTLEGYTFDGWYEDVYCLVEAGFTSKQSKFNITSNTTLYGQWKATAAVVDTDPTPDPDPDPDPDPVDVTIDTARNAFLYFDASSLAWSGASLKYIATYTDESVTSKNGENATLSNGLFKLGYNKNKTLASLMIMRVTTLGDTENTFAISFGSTPFNADKPVYKAATMSATSINGQWVALNTEPEQTIATLYLDVSRISWWGDDQADTNVHIWYEDGSNNTWPGAKMTLVDGLYQAEYYSSKTVKGIIFTRNDPALNPASGVPTEWARVDVSDVAFNSQKPVYRVEYYLENETRGRWTALDEDIPADDPISEEDVTRFFIDYSAENLAWFGSNDAVIAIYVWYSDFTSDVAYPGAIANKLGGIAYINVNKNKTIAGFVVTRNDPKKPVTGEGDGLWNKIQVENVAINAEEYAYKFLTVDGGDQTGKLITVEEATEVQEPQPIVPEPEPDPSATVTVYFKNVSAWAQVNAYAWTGEDAYLGAWPGAIMTAVEESDGWFKTDVPVSATYIVFNNKTDGVEEFDKTENLVINASAPYYNGSWQASMTLDEADTVKLYFKNNGGYDGVYAYAWKKVNDDTTEYLGAWPGKAMTASAENEGWFEITVSKSAVNIIFSNNGKGYQTDDLSISEATPYYDNGWRATLQDDTAKRTIYFKNNSSWATVYAYAWTDGNEYLGSWAGTVMKQVQGKEGWFSVDVAEAAVNVIFTNGMGDKTGDLDINGSTPYYDNGWRATMEVEPVKVYFKKYNDWSTAYAYAFTGTTPYLGPWPGELMTAETEHDGWYSIQVNGSAQYIIFADYDGENTLHQTADLPINVENLYYTGSEWTADFE